MQQHVETQECIFKWKIKITELCKKGKYLSRTGHEDPEGGGGRSIG